MLKAPDTSGERFIASGPFLKMIDIANVVTRDLGTEAAYACNGSGTVNRSPALNGGPLIRTGLHARMAALCHSAAARSNRLDAGSRP